MSDKEVIKVDCGCGCSCGDAFNLEIWLEDWEEYCFISSQANVFYLKQTSFFKYGRLVLRLRGQCFVVKNIVYMKFV